MQSRGAGIAGNGRLPAFVVTTRIGLLWLFPLIGVLLTLAIVFHEMYQTTVDVPIVNLAGRQRLLSQQLLAHAEAVRNGRDEDRAKIEDLVGTFDRALHALEHGGEELGQTFPPAPSEVQPEFGAIKSLWQEIKPALLTVAGAPLADAGAQRAYRQVRANMHLLTQASDRLVGAFQERALTLRKGILQMLVLVAGANCILLLLGVKTTRDYVIERGRSERELLESQERLQHLAHYDPVTGLPNRVLFFDRLEQALARSRWHKRLVAVLLLDLDRFKTINDTLGHHAGDQLLKEVAARWKGAVREGDTVARLGGDEFVIVLVDVAEEHDVLKAVAKIVEVLDQAFVVDGHELFVTTSIGISLHPADGDAVQTLVQSADVAMYRAKKNGRNTCQFYSPALNAQAPQRLALENDLRRALARGEFLLHFQPIVDLRTGCVAGMEALLRWRHPQKGIMDPTDFIPLLEETGLIVPVGEWVMHAACTQAGSWRARGHGPLRLAVNLSTLQLRQDDLVGMVERACTETGFDPRLLEIELTESVFLEHSDVVGARLQRLRDIGASIVIDDFGTGYSSLSYLRRFSVSGVKIDYSFMKGVTTNADDAAIVRAIIALAHGLKITVVAEGVETDAQLSWLREAGCDTAQGYLFSQPLSPEGFEHLLQKDAAKASRENKQVGHATGTGGVAMTGGAGNLTDRAVAVVPATSVDPDAADIAARVEVEQRLLIAHRRQGIIKTLLEISLIDISLEGQLDRALDVLLAIDWLPLRDGMGAIFLVEDEPGVLILRAMRGFPAAMRAACGRVRFGDCVCGMAAQTRQVMCVGDGDSGIELRYRPDVHAGYYAIPIASREQVIGVLSLYADGCCRLDTEEGRFLEVVAGTLAAIIERKCAEEKTVRFLEENRRLNRRLIDVQEEERKALARELHDEMGQALAAIKTEAALMIDCCKGPGLPICESARAIGVAADHLYGLTHCLIRRLRPTALDDLGLAAALETLVSDWRSRRPGLPCRLTVEGDLHGLPDAVNVAIFRLVQEALTNVLRHAVASHMSVTLCRSADAVLVRVEDDGRGLDPAGVKRTWQHFGLLGMRERVEGLGGCLDIESVPGRGLCLHATIPAAAVADRER
jgi:diguanylate cyclase (GGDEF)-like protein